MYHESKSFLQLLVSKKFTNWESENKHNFKFRLIRYNNSIEDLRVCIWTERKIKSNWFKHFFDWTEWEWILNKLLEHFIDILSFEVWWARLITSFINFWNCFKTITIFCTVHVKVFSIIISLFHRSPVSWSSHGDAPNKHEIRQFHWTHDDDSVTLFVLFLR